MGPVDALWEDERRRTLDPRWGGMTSGKWPDPRFPHRAEYDFVFRCRAMPKCKHTEPRRMVSAVKQMGWRATLPELYLVKYKMCDCVTLAVSRSRREHRGGL